MPKIEWLTLRELVLKLEQGYGLVVMQPIILTHKAQLYHDLIDVIELTYSLHYSYLMKVVFIRYLMT